MAIGGGLIDGVWIESDTVPDPVAQKSKPRTVGTTDVENFGTRRYVALGSSESQVLDGPVKRP